MSKGLKIAMDVFQSVRRDGPLAVRHIDAMADLTVRSSDGETLLHAAIAYNNDHVAEALILRNVDVNAQDVKGLTPLHYCAAYGNERLAQLILDAGADTSLLDSHGNSPLWTAVMQARGNYAIVRSFIRHDGLRMAKIANKHGRSPLDFAKQIGDMELVELLTGSEEPDVSSSAFK